jgi:hypothetical protein
VQKVAQDGVPFERLFDKQCVENFRSGVVIPGHSAFAVRPLESVPLDGSRDRKREVRLPRPEFRGAKELHEKVQRLLHDIVSRQFGILPRDSAGGSMNEGKECENEEDFHEFRARRLRPEKSTKDFIRSYVHLRSAKMCEENGGRWKPRKLWSGGKQCLVIRFSPFREFLEELEFHPAVTTTAGMCRVQNEPPVFHDKQVVRESGDGLPTPRRVRMLRTQGGTRRSFFELAGIEDKQERPSGYSRRSFCSANSKRNVIRGRLRGGCWRGRFCFHSAEPPGGIHAHAPEDRELRGLGFFELAVLALVFRADELSVNKDMVLWPARIYGQKGRADFHCCGNRAIFLRIISLQLGFL